MRKIFKREFKNIRKLLIPLIVYYIGAYGLSWFVGLSWDFTQWSEANRMLFVASGLFLWLGALIYFGICAVIKE